MVSFLAFWDPVAGIFKSVGSGLLGALLSGLRLLFYFFAEYIYKAMVLLYDVFNVLCSTRLLDNDILDVLSARVGIVLGLFMLFYVIFSFIKMLIDPDQITDKSKGAVGIVKKILIVIVMLGVSSFCFRSLFSLQAAIVENHVVSKLFLPFNPDNSSELNNKFGNILLNTSNKSEASVGYGTLYGDMCGGLSVIGDVYKSEAYELARFINKEEEIIPWHTIEKAPSAELRPDQKDSDSLPDYGLLDAILFQYNECSKSAVEITAMGFDGAVVDLSVSVKDEMDRDLPEGGE